MGLRDLSEAIILQCASDLLDAPRNRDALDFFSGEGFRLCAEMAKVEHDEKIRFLSLLTDCICACNKNRDHPKVTPGPEDKKASGGNSTFQRWKRNVAKSAA